MTIRSCITEYTEAEFIGLLEELRKEDKEAETDIRADALLLHFEKISQHPAGSDLIYYPENGSSGSPENVTRIVKEWRKSNGLPGFKSPAPIVDHPPLTPPTACSRSPRTRS